MRAVVVGVLRVVERRVFVGVSRAGRIAKTGGRELALSVEAQGYGWLEKQAPEGTAMP